MSMGNSDMIEKDMSVPAWFLTTNDAARIEKCNVQTQASLALI